jgi:hypothetical protein
MKHVNHMESLEGLYALGEAQQAADKYQEAVNTFRRASEIAVSILESGENVRSCGMTKLMHCIALYTAR